MANVHYGYGQQGYGQPIQQGYGPAPPTQAIIHNPQSQPTPSQDYQGYGSSRSCASGLGVTILVMGILCMIFQLVASLLYFMADDGKLSAIDGYVWTGFWIGIWFVITGSIGAASGGSNNKGLIIAFMVLNIFSCVLFVWPLLSLASMSLGIINECSNRYSAYYWITKEGPCTSSETTGIAMNALIIILAVSLFIISLTASIVGCCSTCCPSRPVQVMRSNTIMTGAPPYAAHYAAGAGTVQITHATQYPTNHQLVHVEPQQPTQELPSYSQSAQPSSSGYTSQQVYDPPAPSYAEKPYPQ